MLWLDAKVRFDSTNRIISETMEQGITEQNSPLYLWYLLRLVLKMVSYYVILCPPLGLGKAVLPVNCVLFWIFVCVCFLNLGTLCHFLRDHFPLSVRLFRAQKCGSILTNVCHTINMSWILYTNSPLRFILFCFHILPLPWCSHLFTFVFL